MGVGGLKKELTQPYTPIVRLMAQTKAHDEMQGKP
jgi:hypothetical protein